MPTKSPFWIVLAFLLGLTPEAMAKRSAPPVVAPLIHGGTEYRADNRPGREGMVVAVDRETARTLWETKAYQTIVIPLLERDVQSVFITGLTVKGDQLIVRNEAGKSFSLNLSNGKTSDAWKLALAYTVALGFIALTVGLCWKNRRRQTPTIR